MSLIIENQRSFPTLETARLILREPRQSDLAAVFRIHQDPQVMRYSGMLPFQKEEEALEELQWFANLFNQRQGLRWMITLKEQDTYIGDLGYHRQVSQHARAELGYKLDPQYWQQGIMSEALHAVLGYAFSHMTLNRVEALVDPRNTASQAILLKHHFVREGILREYEFEYGEFVDLTMFSLLKREWQTVAA